MTTRATQAGFSRRTINALTNAWGEDVTLKDLEQKDVREFYRCNGLGRVGRTEVARILVRFGFAPHPSMLEGPSRVLLLSDIARAIDGEWPDSGRWCDLSEEQQAARIAAVERLLKVYRIEPR